MRAYAQKGYKTALTRMTPYFPVYPAMVESAGLIHSDMRYYQQSKKPIALIDSPSNPEGDITDFGALAHTPVIWDAVYHSNVYTYRKFGPITHDVVVGSYSNLLGLNGLRTGWIATDDYLLFERLKNVVSAEYCGLSSASDAILLEVLKDYKDPKFWDLFEFRARRNLDSNREEWSKLERYFAFAIPSNGMFHYTPMDAQCKALMQKSNIEWTSGHSLGTDDNYGRFNIGQDCKIVRAAVKEVLKNDRR